MDGSVIYLEDLSIIGIDPSVLEEWIEDELLASLAVEQGLENTRKSRLLQNRTRQLYLRDELLSRVNQQIPFPDSTDVLEYMRGDSLAYLVERHYYHILVSNQVTADSIHDKLTSGENFQITAERLSIGQKAGIGGDLGYLTAGELMAYGIPRQLAIIEDLGEVTGSGYGWHIFLADDIRPLEDTSRVLRIVADDLFRQRLAHSRDSLLEIAVSGREVYLDSVLVQSNGQFHDDYTDGGDAE